MTKHRSPTLQAGQIGGVLVARVVALRTAKRVRVRLEVRKIAALNEWENEGGRVVAPARGK